MYSVIVGIREVIPYPTRNALWSRINQAAINYNVSSYKEAHDISSGVNDIKIIRYKFKTEIEAESFIYAIQNSKFDNLLVDILREY